MNVDVRVDIAKAVAKLRDVAASQIPFATAVALTKTATQTATLLTNKLPEFFDRPTPYTMRAIGTERATKGSLSSRVFVKRDQLKYLTFGIDGGTRLPRRRALTVPVDQPVNQYGNLARGTVRKLLARKDVFSGTVHGVGGIWQRKGPGQVTLLVAYKPKATYKKRFPFFELAQQTARDAFPQNFRIAVADAMRTAR